MFTIGIEHQYQNFETTDASWRTHQPTYGTDDTFDVFTKIPPPKNHSCGKQV